MNIRIQLLARFQFIIRFEIVSIINIFKSYPV